ncbi:type I-F CRISPR-associated protein Csy2 [Ideonella livida]|uniref:Type I-F CRISPR-associated protein Csy2 n=1 Tax=Ideonella livida TaxID=2707176 RepID=A0A7C9PKI4_9BURK|nr:type I-F CRISPR-associated protein Csy2 [Ideonella livida]NDY93314.1 type I-F CRISPR-associated protein Csy2 [Ideonella livida]
MTTDTVQLSAPDRAAVLVLPHLRVQGANAISSPLTWGFPAMTAFTGLMTALERRLGPQAGIAFLGVGVVCHGYEAQVSGGYTRAFHLSRHPVLADGSSAALVEEGRIHLDLTLVFSVDLAKELVGDAERAALAARVGHTLASMRLAGGSVLPPIGGVGTGARRKGHPSLALLADVEDAEAGRAQFRKLARQWMPGFALVSRDDLLQNHLAHMRQAEPATTVLDAWLDLSRWNSQAALAPDHDGEPTDATPATWTTAPRAGWTVPIPVGFAGLTPLQAPGTVAGARDRSTPVRFVETVWSMGQWISPHRLRSLADLVWFPVYTPPTAEDSAHALYRCVNEYTPSPTVWAPEAING